MNKLHLALLANFIASIFAFFQLQGHYVWNKPFLKSALKNIANAARVSYFCCLKFLGLVSFNLIDKK